jgi:hypothetical protein
MAMPITSMSPRRSPPRSQKALVALRDREGVLPYLPSPTSDPDKKAEALNASGPTTRSTPGSTTSSTRRTRSTSRKLEGAELLTHYDFRP